MCDTQFRSGLLRDTGFFGWRDWFCLCRMMIWINDSYSITWGEIRRSICTVCLRGVPRGEGPAWIRLLLKDRKPLWNIRSRWNYRSKIGLIGSKSSLNPSVGHRFELGLEARLQSVKICRFPVYSTSIWFTGWHGKCRACWGTLIWIGLCLR